MRKTKETTETELTKQLEISELYDCRTNQRIPLSARDGLKESRCWHHLKPLSNERYFQFINDLEVVKLKNLRKVSEIYKPHYTLWQELFIEREGAKEKNSDVLFTEAVQAINALLYYESLIAEEAEEAEEGFLLDDDDGEVVSFRSIYSGNGLKNTLEYKSAFINDLDGYQSTQTDKKTVSYQVKQISKTVGVTSHANDKAQRLYEFALPHIEKAGGYAGNNLEAVPAWHIVEAAHELFMGLFYRLNAKPFIYEN